MTTFFTSDQHFGHANILVYEDECRRDQHGNRFESVEQMDEYMIEQWNAVVRPGDTVYCLGDFSYKQATIESVMPRMNGSKILIVGNHDPYFKRLHSDDPEQQALSYENAARAGFQSIHTQLDVEIDGVGLARLSHFPYWPVEPEPLDCNRRYPLLRPEVGRERVLMHGHIHSQWRLKKEFGRPLMLNVGVDMWQMRPVSESEIAKKVKEFTDENILLGF